MVNSYSYANDIGFFLRSPLVKLTGNMAISFSQSPYTPQVQRVSKIALHCFIAAVFVLPAGILWLAGRAICCLSNAQIDWEGLYLSPPPMQVLQEQGDSDIDVQEIYNQYNLLEINEPVAPGRTSKKDCLERLCRWVKEINANIYPDQPNKRDLFCQQMSLYLRGILKKMSSGDMQLDKKEEILQELTEASTRCYPTWLQVASSLYADINDQAETVPVKLLRTIQEYKESLILEFAQQEGGFQWHSLNFVKNILGIELGLDTSLNDFDPYVGHEDPVFSRALTKWIFLQKYTDINRLVEAIRTKINAKPYDIAYHEYLGELVGSSQDVPQDYVAETFYDADYKLTYEAISFMLQSIGVLR